MNYIFIITVTIMAGIIIGVIAYALNHEVGCRRGCNGGQNPAEWSEEDESMYTRCIGILGKCYMGELPTKVEEELNWLKSLKDKILIKSNG